MTPKERAEDLRKALSQFHIVVDPELTTGESLIESYFKQAQQEDKAQGRHDGMTEGAKIIREKGHEAYYTAYLGVVEDLAKAIETLRDNPKKETV